MATIAVYRNEQRSRTGLSFEIKSDNFQAGGHYYLREVEGAIEMSPDVQPGPDWKKRQASLRDKTIRLNVRRSNVIQTSRREATIEPLEGQDNVVRVSGFDFTPLRTNWI